MQTDNTSPKHATREDWLNAFITAARPIFAAVNAPLPLKVRVAIGFTSRGIRGSRIGECWSTEASEDGHYEIFIKPTLDNAARICDVLTHELIHAAVGIKAGHGPAFKRVMIALGLKGKPTATVAGEDWYRWALPIIADLGAFPYGAMTGGATADRKKQRSYLLKVQCTHCEWTARVTAKHLDPYARLRCPDVECDGELIGSEGT